MRYILKLITRFNNYKNKNNCICYFLIIIGFSEGEAKVNFAMKYPNKELFHIHKNNI